MTSLTIRTLHKWLMRCIGIQMFIWAATGLYMVSMDIHFIHGETLTDDKHATFNIGDATYPISELLARFPTATDIVLYKRLDTLAYQFSVTNSKQSIVVSAQNGNELSLITQSDASHIALASVAEPANIRLTKLIDLPQAMPAELSPRWLPVWQVTFDDLAATTFYIQQSTGQIVTRRHHFWRAFDWMWRFHIMDYDDGENVANPLLTVLAILAVIAIISGVVLLISRFIPVRPSGVNTAEGVAHE
ncbi:PepSY domain-containing protein [Aestuariibacter sp. GS-14]|nr:PepSY domain-containing protein [Aestuariibacter sp. GS-14]